jgi:hypothetical protein
MSFSLLINIKAQTFSKETFIIETTFGEIKLKLYEETPVHKANFKKSNLKTELTESEYMKNIPKIWDSGKMKFEMIIK